LANVIEPGIKDYEILQKCSAQIMIFAKNARRKRWLHESAGYCQTCNRAGEYQLGISVS
jgi:hypothetical protein